MKCSKAIIHRKTHRMRVFKILYQRNRFIRFRSAFLLSSLPFLLVITSCATTKPISTVINYTPKSEAVRDGSTVAILKPLLKFEKIHDESIVPASDYDGNAIEIEIADMAKDVVASRNIPIFDFQGQNEGKVRMYYELNSSIPKLSRGIVSSDAVILLKNIATIDPHVSVLVNYVKVKVGSSGTWNPSGGAITSPNSKTVLNAALIQCATGEVLWMDQVLLREIPKLTSSQFSEALELLFTKFPKKEN